VLGENFPLAQLSGADVDRYITQRRSEWSVPPRTAVVGKEGNVMKPAHSGRHVTDHTIAKELVALRAALKLAKRRGIWKGDPAEVLPVGFAPDYKPRERFLTYDELQALLAELLEDAAARVAFTVATSAEAAAAERAMREDVSPDRLFVQVRGSKRATRWRKVPIVTIWQRQLLDFALEHAQGQDGRLFLPRTKFGQTLVRACDRAGVPRCTPNDLRRTYSTWLRADGVPNELSAPTMGQRTRACSIASTRGCRRSCCGDVCSRPSGRAVLMQ
jgi:integrase